MRLRGYGKVQEHHELVHDGSACLANLAIQPNVTNELLHRDQVRAHAFRVRVMKASRNNQSDTRLGYVPSSPSLSRQ